MTIAYEFLKITEAAAIAAADWVGKGRKKAGDGAAVDAMREAFSKINIKGTIIIGEGEKDEAPMLYTGEQVGTGTGWETDISVDPVEGTNLMASGRPNAISVIGASEAGTMYDPGPSYYMKKIVVPEKAAFAVDIDAEPGDNLNSLAKALNKKINEITVFILDKPRHKPVIEQIRKTGARIQLHSDGDVAGALMAASPDSEIDIMMGTGGTPEGVISACAVKLLGGRILGLLDPKTDAERKAVENYGTNISKRLSTEDFVSGNRIIFCATGISGGTFLKGVEKKGNRLITTSLILDGISSKSITITSTHI